MKRQQIEDRKRFTYDEKMLILRKSDGRCCHCGKKIFPDFEMTVDHYVPLSKGGSNDDVNRVALCYNCNQEKDNAVIQPEEYLFYLDKQHFDKIQEYFDSYIASFEYIERQNILKCDRYTLKLLPPSAMMALHHANKKKRDKIVDRLSVSYYLKKAKYSDIEEKLLLYFCEYLKKYHALSSEKAAKINLQFYYKFGCIYYIEKNNDIKAMCAILPVQYGYMDDKTTTVIRPVDEVLKGRDEKIKSYTMPRLKIMFFALHSNDNTSLLAITLREAIIESVCTENGLSLLQTSICVLKTDPLADWLTHDAAVTESPDGYFCMGNQAIYDKKKLTEADIKKTIGFFRKFKHIATDLYHWYQIPEHKDFDWMALSYMDQLRNPIVYEQLLDHEAKNGNIIKANEIHNAHFV